jgi:hypothetical protein
VARKNIGINNHRLRGYAAILSKYKSTFKLTLKDIVKPEVKILGTKNSLSRFVPNGWSRYKRFSLRRS